ncbi:MAG: ribosome maturation factor RimP [Acidobacteriota bacterium]
MSQPALDASMEAEFASVAESSGCELVHVDFRQGKLQVFLDRPQGVTIDDCQTVSRQLSALLDVSDFGQRSYVLEVSSPGLDRPLYGPKDYERFCGQLVRVTFHSRSEQAKKTIVGRLESYRPGPVNGEAKVDGEISVVEVPSAAIGRSGGKAKATSAAAEEPKRYEIQLSEIVKARLEIEL